MSDKDRRVKRLARLSRERIGPSRVQHVSQDRKPDVDSVCDVCGSDDFRLIRSKVYCAKCNTLLSSCCD
jgi:hypothetical protein